MMSLELVSSQLTIAELEQQFGSTKPAAQPVRMQEVAVHTAGSTELVRVELAVAGCRGAVFFEPISV